MTFGEQSIIGEMEALMVMQLNISVGVKQTLRASLIDQFRLSTDPSYNISVVEKSEDFIFRQVSDTLRSKVPAFQSAPMQTAYFHKIYRSVCQRLFSCEEYKVFCKAFNPSLPGSFVGYFQNIFFHNSYNLNYFLIRLIPDTFFYSTPFQ